MLRSSNAISHIDKTKSFSGFLGSSLGRTVSALCEDEEDVQPGEMASNGPSSRTLEQRQESFVRRGSGRRRPGQDQEDEDSVLGPIWRLLHRKATGKKKLGVANSGLSRENISELRGVPGEGA